MGLQRWEPTTRYIGTGEYVGDMEQDAGGDFYAATDVGALLARIRAVSDDIRYAIDHEAWGLASEASDTLDDLLTEGGK